MRNINEAGLKRRILAGRKSDGRGAKNDRNQAEQLHQKLHRQPMRQSSGCAVKCTFSDVQPVTV
jgi:hypothetical protein